MVQQTKIDFPERFMKLQKVNFPEDWIGYNGFKGKLLNNIDELKDEKGTIMIKSGEGVCFYALYDHYEQLKVDFKIYPIKNREFWVVEVN